MHVDTHSTSKRYATSQTFRARAMTLFYGHMFTRISFDAYTNSRCLWVLQTTHFNAYGRSKYLQTSTMDQLKFGLSNRDSTAACWPPLPNQALLFSLNKTTNVQGNRNTTIVPRHPECLWFNHADITLSSVVALVAPSSDTSTPASTKHFLSRRRDC